MTCFRQLLRFCLAALAAAALAAAPAAAAGKKAEKPKAEAPHHRITPSPNYVPVFGLQAAMSEDFDSTGRIIVDIGLDIPDEALRTQAVRMQPRLRDALRTALSDYATVHYRRGAKPDPDVIARMAQTAVDRALGKAGAQVTLSSILVLNR